VHDIQIEEGEGEREVEVLLLESEVIVVLIKVKKINIGIVDNPKMDNIGEYLDEKRVEIIEKILHEYNNLFPTMITKMKEIEGEIGKMKLLLRYKERPIEQRPYRLNLIYKKKFKAKIDRMLEAGIIEPIEEYEWVSPMVV
jgi:hypothetical protein